MSQERVLKTLMSLGLTQLDSQVYVFLGKRGLTKGKDIAKALKVHKQQVYRSLKKLQNKGIVSATLERPARYSAEPFQKVIDLFIKAKMEEAQHLRQSKAAILSDWQSIAIGEIEDTSEKFTVIKGRNIIYSKMQQMMQQTKKHLSTMTTVPNLVRADQFGLFDTSFDHPSKTKIKFRFLTELSKQNVNAMKDLLKTKMAERLNFDGRTPDLGLKVFPRMVIRDDEETMFFINPEADASTMEQDDVGLWTNCKSLVHSFSVMFEELWRNSTDIQKKIAEIEAGKPTPKTIIISDAEAARKKYDEIVRSAEDDIIMLTSAKGLIESLESSSLLKEQAKKGVIIKIMAPIMNENLEAANQLSKHFEVRHVPVSYLRTTIIDGKHLFQFKNPPPEQEKPEATPYYEDAFYSDDPEYVDKTKTMISDIWKSAHVLSPITLASVLRPSAPKVAADSDERRFSVYRKTIARIEDEKLGAKTEKDILSKFINAQKYPAELPSKDIIRGYHCSGHAIIHPPKHFNLPDMMFHFYHVEKQSSLGAEDSMGVYLWLKTPEGHKFVPVAMVGDNPRTTKYYKIWLAGTPAEHNVQLVKKDEFEIRVHGNTLFAGWTVPIPLTHSSALPPSCIIIEGYGNIKTGSFTSILPSGYKFKFEANGFDAFVTFMHPSSKYTGPGTDGYFCRDAILDIYPP